MPYELDAGLDTRSVVLAEVERNVENRERLDAQRHLFAQPVVSVIGVEGGLQDRVIAQTREVDRRVLVTDVAEVDDADITR